MYNISANREFYADKTQAKNPNHLAHYHAPRGFVYDCFYGRSVARQLIFANPKKLRKQRKERGIGVTFFSVFFFFAGLAVLVMIGVALGKETYRKRQIQKEIESLQSEIQKTSQKNSELSNLISYLATQDFQEKEAREKLNLQKEDEKMIVLKKDAVASADKPDSSEKTADPAIQDNSPNWKKWLSYFFGKDN